MPVRSNDHLGWVTVPEKELSPAEIKIEHDKEQARRDRQSREGPAERAFKGQIATEVRAEIDGTRTKQTPPPAQKQEQKPEATRMALTPQSIVPQPAPSPGGGIVYRNSRAVQRKPEITATEELTKQHKQLITGKDVLQKLRREPQAEPAWKAEARADIERTKIPDPPEPSPDAPTRSKERGR